MSFERIKRHIRTRRLTNNLPPGWPIGKVVGMYAKNYDEQGRAMAQHVDLRLRDGSIQRWYRDDGAPGGFVRGADPKPEPETSGKVAP